MKPAKYNTIMPRIAIESQKLIHIDDIRLLFGKNFNEILSFLKTTTYGETIPGDIQGFEKAYILLEELLYENYALSFHNLLQYSSDYIASFLRSLLYRFDSYNLKTMLRMVNAGIPSDLILKNLIPIGGHSKKRCRVILSGVNSMSDFINSLSDQDFGFFLRDKLKAHKTYPELSLLEAFIEKEAFGRIFEEITKLDRNDKKIASKIIGIEIDVLNVKIILKCKAVGINDEKIEDYLMPMGLLDDNLLRSAINQPNIESAFQAIFKGIEPEHQIYKNFYLKLMLEADKPISHLESLLDRISLEMSLFELKKNMRYYNIAYILAFLNLKWTEIKNLRCIINAAVRNVFDPTHDLLIIPENYNII